MTTAQMKKYIADGGINERLTHIYGEAAVEAQKARYSAAIDEFAAIYGADRALPIRCRSAGQNFLYCPLLFPSAS